MRRADKRRRQTIVAVAVAGLVLAVFALLPTIARLYVDLHWFRSLGLSDVFSTVLETRVVLGIVTGLVAFAVVFANVLVAMRLTRGRPPLLLEVGDTVRVDVDRVLRRVAPAVAIVIGAIAGLGASSDWERWLLWTNAVPFGVRDPVFGRDVGFYVFELPLLEDMRASALVLVVVSVAVSLVVYALRRAIGPRGRGIGAERGARAHVSVLGALVFLLFAAGAWLDTANLLYSTTGPVAGASYSDVHALLPALRVEIAMGVVCAALVALSATRTRLVLVWVAVAVWIGVDIVAVRIVPSIVQHFDVVPNEAVKEASFIRHNIDATRAAFGIDRIVDRELEGELHLSMRDIEDNRATIENIRLWDHQPLLDTFGQIQEIRTYYEFVSVDNDRYMIDGALRQTMLSPRELAAETLPNRTWINERFTFTHGYGVTVGPVNRSTDEGLPPLYVKDLPPVSTARDLRIARPGIYFGEHTNDYVFVHTRAREFDYPSGDENVFAQYRGRDGVVLDSAWMRLAMATELGSFRLLLSDDITSRSRVLLHRNVKERIQRIAPFLVLDRDPYMVVRANGRLAWILDAYTTTDRYPYAQPDSDGINYIRNSVKVVLDAYDGTVAMYIADARDPILRAWRRAFPRLFRPLSAVPADLRVHLRYPEDLFRRQTEKLTVYHMDRPELIYNREDQWEVPAIATSQEGSRLMEPYYTVMRLPREARAEFILMLPFTPKRKDNLAAWIVARNDGAHLGELVVYRFPKDRLVFGPQQVMNRINQDASISRQITLWDQRGSHAILGTLLVIPIRESLIYVCPLYLRSEGGRIPELKRVIVVHENRIAMGATLDAAITSIFAEPVTPSEAEAAAQGEEAAGAREAAGQAEQEPQQEAPRAAVATRAPPLPDGEAALRREARATYERAIAAQRRGDWARYGTEIDRLGRILERLAR